MGPAAAGDTPLFFGASEACRRFPPARQGGIRLTHAGVSEHSGARPLVSGHGRFINHKKSVVFIDLSGCLFA